MCTSESGCGCATVTIESAPPAAERSGGVRTTYPVSGMTCGGCANAVRRQVAAVPGVTDVQVDVTAGTVTVTSATQPEAGQIRAAVEQAGYQLAG